MFKGETIIRMWRDQKRIAEAFVQRVLDFLRMTRRTGLSRKELYSKKYKIHSEDSD